MFDIHIVMSFIHLSIVHEHTCITSYIHMSIYPLHLYLYGLLNLRCFHIIWEKEWVIVLPIDMKVNIIVLKPFSSTLIYNIKQEIAPSILIEVNPRTFLNSIASIILMIENKKLFFPFELEVNVISLPYSLSFHPPWTSLNCIAFIILWDQEQAIALPFELEVDVLLPITLNTITSQIVYTIPYVLYPYNCLTICEK